MDIFDALDAVKAKSDIISSVGQLLIGLGFFGNMWISYCTLRISKQVHVATNSMKDELVRTTQTAAELKGRADERREAKQRKDADEKHL